MSLLDTMPVTDGRKKRLAREFVTSPDGPIHTYNIRRKDTPMGRNAWVAVEKRVNGAQNEEQP